MNSLKAVCVFMMTLLVGINGLLGSQLTATVCIHGSELFHLMLGSHTEEQEDCSDHSNSTEPSECDSEPATNESHFVGAERNCTDLQFEALENLALNRVTDFKGMLSPKLLTIDEVPVVDQSRAVRLVQTHLAPPQTGPPNSMGLVDLCVKTTVLRL